VAKRQPNQPGKRSRPTSAARKGQTSGLASRGLGDLQGVLRFLTEHHHLAQVKTAVAARFELGGVANRFHGGKAVLFEQVQGSPYPVLAGLYWNRSILARLFDVPETELSFHFADAVARWQQRPIPPELGSTGPAQEVVERSVDLRKLPISQVGMEEGGPYVTAAVVIAKDPDTGVRNASIMRLMLTGRDRMTCLMDIGRHLRDYYERVEARGKPLEVTINVGVDPAVHFASVVPASAAPIDTDELGIASELLGEPLQLVAAKTVDADGVAAAQFILEAEILPKIREPEGPAAEVTGYYASRDDRWVAKIKKITRRKEPVWHTIIPGREVHNAVGLMAEASIFRLVSRQVPGLRGVYLSYGGCGFYHAVVQLQKQIEGVQRNAILATLAAFPPLKQVTVVDEDVNIYDPQDVEWAVATRLRPDRDIILVPEARGHELNPVTDGGLVCKMGLDATAPFPRPPSFQRVKMRDVELERYEIDEP